MTRLGWVFMVFSWSMIICLAFFCFFSIFKKKKID